MADSFSALKVCVWNIKVNLPECSIRLRPYAKTSVQTPGRDQKPIAPHFAPQSHTPGWFCDYFRFEKFLAEKTLQEFFWWNFFGAGICPRWGSIGAGIFWLCASLKPLFSLGFCVLVREGSYFRPKVRVTSFKKKKGILKGDTSPIETRTSYSLSIVGKSFEKFEIRALLRLSSSVQAFEIGGLPC
jgi:hypothetical protein